MEEEAEVLRGQGQAEAAEELSATAAGFREQAQASRAEAALKEQEVAELRSVYPQCFGG